MVIYNLFLRNWINHKANEMDIDEAVTKGLLTVEQGEEIKNSTR